LVNTLMSTCISAFQHVLGSVTYKKAAHFCKTERL
jgi:hypothetical protein